jgi:hypothetical protein
MENLEKFSALVAESPALFDALKASTDEASFAKIAVELGTANGCQFTAEDAIAWLKAQLHPGNTTNG